MNNNLSKQLCELCGIEAKQFTKDFKTREKAASFGRKITGIPKFRGNKFDIGSYTDNKSIYQIHWKEFPDFTKPVNFVRLWEILTKVNRDELVACAINLVTFDPEKCYYSKLKQSIREAEWVYE